MDKKKPTPHPRDKPPRSIGDEEIPEKHDPDNDDIGDPTPGKKIEDPRPGKEIKLPPDPDENPDAPVRDPKRL